MDWKELGSTVARIGAPLLGGALGGPPGAAIGALIASVFGEEVDPKDPASIQKAISGDPEAAIKLRKLELDHKVRLQGLALDGERMRLADEAARLRTVNETMRAEYSQEDPYVKRWRPTMGYGVTASWVITWVGVVYVLVFETEKAPQVISALGASSVLWGVALSVLGISVYQRSGDKAIEAGHAPRKGVLAAVAERIAGPAGKAEPAG